MVSFVHAVANRRLLRRTPLHIEVIRDIVRRDEGSTQIKNKSAVLDHN